MQKYPRNTHTHTHCAYVCVLRMYNGFESVVWHVGIINDSYLLCPFLGQAHIFGHAQRLSASCHSRFSIFALSFSLSLSLSGLVRLLSFYGLSWRRCRHFLFSSLPPSHFITCLFYALPQASQPLLLSPNVISLSRLSFNECKIKIVQVYLGRGTIGLLSQQQIISFFGSVCCCLYIHIGSTAC